MSAPDSFSVFSVTRLRQGRTPGRRFAMLAFRVPCFVSRSFVRTAVSPVTGEGAIRSMESTMAQCSEA